MFTSPPFIFAMDPYRQHSTVGGSRNSPLPTGEGAAVEMANAGGFPNSTVIHMENEINSSAAPVPFSKGRPQLADQFSQSGKSGKWTPIHSGSTIPSIRPQDSGSIIPENGAQSGSTIPSKEKLAPPQVKRNYIHFFIFIHMSPR